MDGRGEEPGERSYQGWVLLDNTTVFGARRAYEWDPRRPGDDLTGVNLRSLMDVLEAIVLFNDFAIDNTSREDYAWPELSRVSRTADGFFHDTALMLGPPEMMPTALAETSAAQLTQVLASGELVRQLGFLPSSREIDVLPPFYRDTDEFLRLSAGYLHAGRAEEQAAARRLRDLARSLQGLHPSVRNFAFFAYRGFYYQQLAHAVSASYQPHSWRSGLIRAQLDRPALQFTDLVLNETAGLRSAMAEGINQEFATAALTEEFPLIASYVLGQCTSRGSLLATAVEIRRNAKARAFRTWIHEIEGKLRGQEDLVSIRQAREDLRTVVHELAVELGLADRQDRQQVVLKLGLPVASAETTTHLPGLPGWARRVLRRRTHLVFLRDLARESLRLAPFARAFQRLAP